MRGSCEHRNEHFGCVKVGNLLAGSVTGSHASVNRNTLDLSSGDASFQFWLEHWLS
jgi:hypothetical protein